MLRLILDNKNLSTYRLEKSSGISHATLLDLYNERTNVEKCSSSLLHNLAQSLDMSMDDLFDILAYNNLSYFAYDDNFDLFKSNICQELKHLGDKDFLKKYLTNNKILDDFENNNSLQALYLLSMIDFLCEKNNLPCPSEYEEVRIFKMNKVYVSKSIFLLLKNKQIKVSQLYKEAIPCFLKHNILEADIYNVA